MFSPIERWGRSAWQPVGRDEHDAGPDRVVRDGARGAACPFTSISPPVGRRWPESASKSSSWPCPSSAATPRISPGRSSKLTPLSVSSTARSRTSSAVGTSSAIRIDSRRCVPAACAARAASGPSMYSTIFTSPPSFGTSVPTSRAVAEDGRVGRSGAITSRRRCVMKSDGAASFLLRRHHREDALGEVGWERRRDLVEDQELRVARERAGEVEHPEHRQRQVGRLLGEVDLEVEVARGGVAPPRPRCS